MPPTCKTTIIVFLTGFLAMAAHMPVVSSRAMIFDDAEYIVHNPLVLNPGFESVRRFFTEILDPSKPGYYQPISMTSLMLDVALGAAPETPAGFRITSLALHGINAGLVTVLLSLMFGNLWAAAFAGMLFGVHPVTVEPVAWISERTTLLATFFGLLTLIAHVTYAKYRNLRWYWTAVILFALGLMTKPTVIALPLMMMVMDFRPLNRWPAEAGRRYGRLVRSLKEKFPFFILALAFGAVFLISMGRAGNVHFSADSIVLKTLLHMCHNLIFYLRHLMWPVGLSPHYPYPEIVALREPFFMFSVAGTGFLTLMLIVSRRWTPALVAGGLVFFIGLTPTMPAVRFSSAIAADKYVYFPLIGILMILTAGVCRFLSTTDAAGKKRRLIALACLAWVVVFLLGGASRSYLKHWRDDVSINTRMVEVAPGPVTHCGLGVALAEQGRMREAVDQLERATALAPEYVNAHMNLGTVYMHLGETGEAVRHFERAYSLRRDSVTRSLLKRAQAVLQQEKDAPDSP